MVKKGFTLIELLVVMGIIGLMSAIIIVAVSAARRTARDGRRLADVKTLKNAIDQTYLKSGKYPIVGSEAVTTDCNASKTMALLKTAIDAIIPGVYPTNVIHDPTVATDYTYIWGGTVVGTTCPADASYGLLVKFENPRTIGTTYYDSTSRRYFCKTGTNLHAGWWDNAATPAVNEAPNCDF
ncbi:MAG: hypothetical protein HW405_176 [Candidatus Berkelbacteria bacterium]|nr:hypothetical protein [Candidatus Berkelbacteria bacterium]